MGVLILALLAFCASLVLWALLALPWSPVFDAVGVSGTQKAEDLALVAPFLSVVLLAGLWTLGRWLLNVERRSDEERKRDVQRVGASGVILLIILILGVAPSFLVTEAICLGGTGNGCGPLAEPSHALPAALVMIAGIVLFGLLYVRSDGDDRRILVGTIPVVLSSIVALREVMQMADRSIFLSGLFLGLIPGGLGVMYLIAVADVKAEERQWKASRD